MILFLSDKDYANVGSRFAQALQSVGEQAEAWYRIPHRFQYPNPGKQYQNLTELPEASTVVFMHSVIQQVPADRYIVFHGGTRYRCNPEKFNTLFNDMVTVTLTQTADLLNQGATNEHWVIPPVDTERLHPSYSDHEPRLFGHFPRISRSIPEIKGTSVVEQEFKNVGVEYRLEQGAVSWEANMQRIREVDVYVEKCATEYEFGMTTLEAAALGKVVITDAQWIDYYEAQHNTFCPLVVANTPEQLYHQVLAVKGVNTQAFREQQERTRAWVEQKHSFEAVGHKLQEILCE